jgi:hypothetical protein
MKKIIPLAAVLFLITTKLCFAGCTVNGADVPCSEFWDQAGPYLIAGLSVLVIMVIYTGFMFVDCIKRRPENTAVWLLLILMGFVVGALAYHLVVRRPALAKGNGVTPAE